MGPGRLLRLASTTSAGNGTGAGQAANGSTELQEIVVTAEKRGEAINSVPMSITAATGDELARRGITEVRDLAKLVPGFTYADSANGTPVYTLRGVGFNDTSIGGRPTVSIYVDEAPIPFSIETLGASVDLERIEVLKGPQGTLFGQNSTAGAINYIAAKPTKTFEAGLNAGYGNFNTTNVGGFVSGPLTDTLSGRIAIDNTYHGDWQKSEVTGAKLGEGDFVTGRASLAWQPFSALKVVATVSGFHDGTETQAAQFEGLTTNPSALASINNPAFTELSGLRNEPIAPANNRVADWDPNGDYHRDNVFYQGNLRIDYTLPHNLLLTSLTSYSHYNEHQLFSNTGVDDGVTTLSTGSVKTIFQEGRISGDFLSHGTFILGANYESDHVYQQDLSQQTGGSISYTFIGLAQQLSGALPPPLFNGLGFNNVSIFRDFYEFSKQESETGAVYLNLDYNVTDQIRIYGGARYTGFEDKLLGACSRDTGDGNALQNFQPLLNLERLTHGLSFNAPVPPGSCLTASTTFVPTSATGDLKEHNTSWRVGADWKPFSQALLYANVSKGYKAGGYPDLGSTSVTQYTPAVQESIIAYEAGFKLSALEHTLQLNGAAFYYDYKNKQVFGYFFDAGFQQAISRLLNIPSSNLKGAELQVQWLPVKGLTVGASASYIDSKIGNFVTLNGIGQQTSDVSGESFPNTPRWQTVADVDYRFPLTGAIDGFVGGDLTYQSSTNSQLGALSSTYVKSYALLDLRAGVQSNDGRWRLSVYGRNVTDEYYWTAAYRQPDSTVRYAGMPATFGVTLNYRYK